MFKCRSLDKLFLGGILICCFNAHGQTVATQRVDFLSPQQADFGKYGGVAASHYNGQLDFNIPIYDITDKEFKIPVSLNYNSSGFMPNRPTGPVGLNWYLAAGGSITRKVNGGPDDASEISVYCAGCSPRAYRGFKLGTAAAPKAKNDAYNFAIGSANSILLFWDISNHPTNSSETHYEYEPDEFSFNAMGHSGKFFIRNDGSVRVLKSP